MKHRKLTVDGVEVVIEVGENSMLLLRNGEIIGQIRNFNGGFSGIPCPQRGHRWEWNKNRDDTIRYILAEIRP